MNLEVNIRKKLKDFVLHVEFQMDSGMLGILGASGCGKSMTLKAIAGLMTPDEGRIVWNNTVLFDSKQKINIPPQKRKVGYLFQNYALFPHMSVEDNIMIGMVGNKKEKKKKLLELVQLLRLEGLEKQYPRQLSGGQQQRVAFARVLAYDPDILLLDEPFSALDSYLKEELQLQLKGILGQYKKTVLMVSHDRDEIYRLSTQMMTMKAGTILQIGKTKDVFEQPKDPITARLVGCRNLSLATLHDAYHIQALEWGISIKMEVPIQKEIKTIGIQEEGLQLFQEMCDRENMFQVEVVDVLEEKYEYHVLVRAKLEREEQRIRRSGKEKAEIWCRVKKEDRWSNLKKQMSVWLWINRDYVFLL